jgi:phytoene dehydrogenase-like protein
MNQKSVIIIGAGIAGLSAGIYARMNGFDTQIFEMHTQPGGLCTSWKRKGYTIDGCIHWLVGSSPKSNFYPFWQEVGLMKGRKFVDSNIYTVFETREGQTVTFYADPDRLEKHLIELAPEDAAVIKEFTDGIRLCLKMDPPAGDKPGFKMFLTNMKFSLWMAPNLKRIKQYMDTTTTEFINKLKSPVLREVFSEIWIPDFSIFFMMFTMAYIQQQNAGYPIGGSTPMIEAMEQRYLTLGGQIHYHSRVQQILVENKRAVGIRLDDGSEYRADTIISAADGHATIYEMLNGKFVDDTINGYYKNYKVFPPLIFVGLGVNRTFSEIPQVVSDLNIPLKQSVEIGEKMRDRISVKIYNQDSTLAPAGKTVLTTMFSTDYEYWKSLASDQAAYQEKKDQIAREVVSQLDQRFPGLAGQVEMVDVATPMTFERYTGNWKASFEGWLMTPENGLKRMSKTLPGLENFYMVGQWVQPGGGLPTGVQTARGVIQMICKKEKVKFTTSLA